MSTEKLEALRVTREGGVAEIVLCGPGKGNAMGPAFWREMPALFEALDKDRDVRVVVVRGDNGHFSYGLDLMSMMTDLGPLMQGDGLAGSRGQLLDLIGAMQLACDRVATCRKPVIAAVTGRCIGGGVDLAAACDIRLCSANASFSVREVKLAIVADIGSLQRLPRIIGEAHTRQLAFTGADIGAARALAIGLVSDVYPDEAALLVAARALAAEIAANAPLTVQGIKQVMNDCEGRPVRDGLRYTAVWNSAFLQSKDFFEAVSAFAEKRPPRFKGE